MSLQTGVLPNEWKIAKGVPLHKGGDLNDLTTVDQSPSLLV